MRRGQTVWVICILSWGTLAFGAVYPWGYWPLLLGCLTLGLVGLIGVGPPGKTTKVLSAGLGCLILAILVQLIPLSRSAIVSVSPFSDVLLRQYSLPYAASVADIVRKPGGESTPRVRAKHPLSIRPHATWLALAFVVAFGVFVLGAERLLSREGSEPLIRAVIVLGVVLAFVGIIQRAIFTEKIYGFWQPQVRGEVFGPFVNRNHFAGWILMVLPLGIGYFFSLIGPNASASRGWRMRVLLLSSSRANHMALVALGLLIMGLSLVLTMSRSGIVCFAVGLTVAGLFVVRGRWSPSRRLLTMSYLAVLPVTVVAWAGIDTIGARFLALSGTGLSGRLGAWRDALRIIRDFPLAGTGLNTYGVATLFYQTSNLNRHYYEAHNDYLQIAAEGGLLLGLPLLMLAILFIYLVGRRLREEEPAGPSYWLRAGAVMGLVTIALQEMFEFSLQIPANAALCAILCAIALHVPPAQTYDPSVITSS